MMRTALMCKECYRLSRHFVPHNDRVVGYVFIGDIMKMMAYVQGML